MFHICFRVLPRLVFMSRLTPILVLFIASSVLVFQYLRPSEPSQANVVAAFAGYKTPNFEMGPVPGARNIRKEGCEKVAEADGFLCKIRYTVQFVPSQTPIEVTRTHRLFQVQGGTWGQQQWSKNVATAVAESQERLAGHQFGRLLAYTSASVILAFVFFAALPRINWSAPGLHERTTPWVGAPVRSGSQTADGVGDYCTTMANNVTPGAVLVFLALGIGAVGFFMGGLVVPQSFIQLRYAGGAERICLLIAALSWGVVGMRMTMLSVQLLALAVVMAVVYGVLVLPMQWVMGGDSLGRVHERNLAVMTKFVSNAKTAQAGAPSLRGREGYEQLMNW